MHVLSVIIIIIIYYHAKYISLLLLTLTYLSQSQIDEMWNDKHCEYEITTKRMITAHK